MTAPIATGRTVRRLNAAEVADLCQRATLRDAVTEAVWLTRGRRVFSCYDTERTIYLFGLGEDRHALLSAFGHETDLWPDHKPAKRANMLASYLDAFDGRNLDTTTETLRWDVVPGTRGWTHTAAAVALWWDERMDEGIAPEVARMLLDLTVASSTLGRLGYRTVEPTPSQIAGGHVTRLTPDLAMM